MDSVAKVLLDNINSIEKMQKEIDEKEEQEDAAKLGEEPPAVTVKGSFGVSLTLPYPEDFSDKIVFAELLNLFPDIGSKSVTKNSRNIVLFFIF